MRGIVKAILNWLNLFHFRIYQRLFHNERIVLDLNRWAMKIGMEELLRRLGATVGEDSRIDHGLTIKNADRGSCHNLRIGRHVRFGPNIMLDLAAPIEIDDEVGIADGTIIVTHFGVGDRPLQRVVGYRKEPVRFEHGAYVGVGSIILHGVTIGECAVVGAGTLVREDVPPRSVVVGVPGKVIKYFSMEPDLQLQRDERGAAVA